MRILLLSLFTAFSMNAFAHDCVLISRITGFNGVSDTELALYTMGRGEYKVTTFYCQNLSFAEEIGFRTFPPGSQSVCEGDDVVVVDRFAHGRDFCAIQKIEKVK